MYTYIDIIPTFHISTYIIRLRTADYGTATTHLATTKFFLSDIQIKSKSLYKNMPNVLSCCYTIGSHS